MARGVPGRKAAWGAKSPWSGGVAGTRLSPPPPARQPHLKQLFPQNANRASAGLSTPAWSCWNSCDGSGHAGTEGWESSKLGGALPTPPSPRSTASPVQSCYMVGQALAMASRAQGRLEAGQGVQEPGASEEIHKPSTQDLGLSTPATVGLAQGTLGPPPVAQPWGGVTPLLARVLRVDPPELIPWLSSSELPDG